MAATKRDFILSSGIGISANDLYIVGSTGSTNSTTGALIVTGGVGIGGSLNVASATAISGVTINAGVITGSLAGTATTATNINIVSASTSASHPVLFTPASGTASGAALSTESTFVYNPSTDILSVSGLAITSGTASTSSTTGALTVSGGVGIGGSLNVGIAVTTFGVPRIASFVGSNNGSSTVVIQNTSTSDSMYASIYFLDYSGSSGFIRKNSTNNSSFAGAMNLYNLGDIVIQAATGYTINIYSVVKVIPGTASISTSSGALIVSGGVGIGGSIFGGSTISAADNIEIKSGKELRLNNTGNTFYTGIKAGANTSNTTYTLPTAFPGAGTSVLQSDTSGTLTWVGAVGLATTATNINVVAATTSASHPVLFTPASGTASGAAVSTESTFVYNPSSDILSVSGLAITSGTASTNTTTGALVVTGGMGIGGNAFIGGTTTITNTTASVSSSTGALVIAGGVGIGGTLNVGADLSISGLTTLTFTSEKLNTKTSAGSAGTVTHDLSTGSVFYHSSISNNFTANFTNVPTTNDRALGVTLILAQGGTPYMSTALQIDGSAQTIKWVNNTTPTGTASKVDIVGFSLIRTGSAWTVLGQYSTYG